MRPNNTGKPSHLQSKQKKRSARNYYTTNMMQTLTHRLKNNAIQMLYKSNKHKANNLIKYTTQEHAGCVTPWTGKNVPQGVILSSKTNSMDYAQVLSCLRSESNCSIVTVFNIKGLYSGFNGI